MKTWDLPKTEKEASTFFQDKELLPTTKQCVNEHNILDTWTQYIVLFHQLYTKEPNFTYCVCSE